MTDKSTPFADNGLIQIQEIWPYLSQKEKVLACEIDDTRIISDFADTANNALLVSGLKASDNNNCLVQWHKQEPTGRNPFTVHTYLFNLVEKGMIDEKMAKIFSSFYLVINVTPKNSQIEDNSLSEVPEAEAQKKAFIAIKKDKVDFILDMITNVDMNFSIDLGCTIKKEDMFDAYSFFMKYYMQRDVFKNIDSILFKKLFCRLLALCGILKSNLLNFFRENTFPEANLARVRALNQQNEISNKINDLALFLKTSGSQLMPLNFKTVSELEKENSIKTPDPQEHSIHSDTNTQDLNIPQKSPKNEAQVEYIPTVDSSKMLVDHVSHKKNSSDLTLENSYQSKGDRPNYSANIPENIKKPEERKKEDQASCQTAFSMYDGIIFEDLVVHFERSDVILYTDDQDTKPQTNPKDMTATSHHSTGDSHSYFYHPLHEGSHFSQQPQYFFYPGILPIHGYGLSPLIGFLPPFQNEQFQPWGMPALIVGSNTSTSTTFLSNQNTERSQDSQSSHTNDKEFGPKNTISQHHNGDYDTPPIKETEKNHNNQKDKQKLKLPPRLKKFRETGSPS